VSLDNDREFTNWHRVKDHFKAPKLSPQPKPGPALWPHGSEDLAREGSLAGGSWVTDQKIYWPWHHSWCLGHRHGHGETLRPLSGSKSSGAWCRDKNSSQEI
jgi:hypothetical protein